MDLSTSNEHRQFADGLERFLAKGHGYEHRRALVRAGAATDPALWQQLADLGCLGLAVPESRGGFGADTVTLGLLARALGRHLVVEPVLPAVRAGLLLTGAIGTQTHLDALIAGTKRYAVADTRHSVAGGMAADHILIADDTSLRLVTATRTPAPMLDDSLAADLSAPHTVQTFQTGDDWADSRARAAAVTTLFEGWQALGCLEAAVDATAAYMRDRVQFGRPLGNFQVVQHRVAEMIVAAKEAEMVALLAALAPPESRPRALATMAARIAAAAALVSESAVQLHGGMGVSDELDIAARFRHLQAYRLRVAAADPLGLYAETVVADGAHHRSAVLAEA